MGTGVTPVLRYIAFPTRTIWVILMPDHRTDRDEERDDGDKRAQTAFIH